MTLSRQDRAKLRIVAVVALIGAAVGIVFAWLLSHIMPFTYDLAEFENGARNGLTVAAALAAFDQFYVHGPRGIWLRRLGFGRTVLVRAVLFTGIIVLCFTLNRLVYGLLHGFERAGLAYFGLPLLRDTILSFVVFLIITEFLQMRRVIGGRTLTNLLLGRYWQPVREERLFMLIDIKGSTALAERLGDERAHAYITRVFFDIDRPILEHGGEVHSYVGDGLIASWPLAEGVGEAACLRCCEAVQTVLRQRAATYRERFGTAPEVRIVLHAGPIVAGECGDAKLAIVYLGDTLNTAARMEEVGKRLDLDCVISDALLARLELPPTVDAEPLGEVRLRGRQQPIALHALRPASDPVAAAAE